MRYIQSFYSWTSSKYFINFFLKESKMKHCSLFFYQGGSVLLINKHFPRICKIFFESEHVLKYKNLCFNQGCVSITFSIINWNHDYLNYLDYCKTISF